MQRREFLMASGAGALWMLASNDAMAAEGGGGGRQIYELRTYHFASPEKMAAFSKHMADVGIAALNRAGVENVGVFALHSKDNTALKLTADPLDLYVLLPHKNFESVATLSSKLMQDEGLKTAGQAVLEAPKKDPAYTRYESSLLWAFEMAPTLTIPTKAPTRILQMR